ncbi:MULTISPECIES: hypothetical protein [Xanthobacter]|uniref:hypothetical protein n=1 Tax=Xanthobacter TaxID=279 RepID=UPI001F2BE851|nr:MULTISPECIES: hypothetical protein [unclassified Xanthobacter]
MASSVTRPVLLSARPAFSSSSRADAGTWRSSSLLISLVVLLFAALLIATPTLAVMTFRPDAPAVAPEPVRAPHLSFSHSQFA